MSIKIPAQIANENPNFPLIRAEDNEVAGIGFFTSIAGRQNLPIAKRTNSYIANMSLSDGTSYLAVFTGDIDTDGDWADGRNWASVANEENVFDILTVSATRRNNTTNNIGDFTNLVVGDYDQDGVVNVDDFLSFFTGYVATDSTSSRTGNTASDRLSGVIGNTTEHLATWEFENYDGTNDFMLATAKAIEEQINLRDLFYTDRTMSSARTHTLNGALSFQDNQSLNILSLSKTEITIGEYAIPLTDGVDGQHLVTDGNGAVEWAFVHALYTDVQNDEGATLRVGDPVYAKGASGNRILIGKCDADDASKMPCIGIVYGDEITDGSNGEIITSGIINKSIPSTGVQIGDTVYVGTSGELTRTKPTGASAKIQNIGTVLDVNASNTAITKLKVSAIDRTNDIPNITTGKFMVGTANYPVESSFTVPPTYGTAGQVLTADGSGASSWQTPTTGSGTVDVSGTPVNNQLAVWVDADTIEGDANVTWDGTNFRVTGKVFPDSIMVDEASISAAGQYGSGSKILERIGSNTTTIAGDLYYLAGNWFQADADAASSSSGLLAIATSTSSNNGMLAYGIVRVADNAGFSSASEGDVLYVDLTAGHVTSDISSYTTGDVVRVVGYVIDATNRIIYFDPSKDWIELS